MLHHGFTKSRALYRWNACGAGFQAARKNRTPRIHMPRNPVHSHLGT